MNKALSILKKTLKAIMWVVGVFVLLFLLVAGIIQIPAVQTRIVHAATSFVSNKTHTHVGISRVSISFPKSVVIEGLFLEDLNKDTLIYAGKTNVNIVLKDLLVNKICVNNIELENLTVNLYNTRSDSLFNYNFLVTAFADSTRKDTAGSKTPSAWTFTVDKVLLKNIRLRYADEFGGMNISASLEKLKLRLKEVNFEKSIYAIDNLLVDGLKSGILLTEPVRKPTTKSSALLPLITAGSIQINHSTLSFGDSINKQSVSANITRFELKTGTVDLQHELVKLNKIYLAESVIQYHTRASVAPDSTIELPASIANNWKVSLNQLDLVNNAVTYTVGSNPKPQKSFDANRMKFRQLNLTANDLAYSSQLTKATVTAFNAIDQNNFAIRQFETHFKMDAHSITAQRVVVRTAKSFLMGNANIEFSSLQSLKDSLPALFVNVDLKKSALANSDILYFSPALADLDFFQNKQNITSISGIIFGRIRNLKGKNIQVQTGDKTTVQTDFSIVGLPNAETAYYTFPNLKLVSGKEDLQMMLGSYLPKTIGLPQDISLLINFKGKIKDFETTLASSSSFGAVNMSARLDAQENFSANMNTINFDMGSLLNNREMYGPVTLNAEVNGRGLDANTLKAQIKADVSEIYLNYYTYHNLTIDGTASGREFSGKVNLNDKNAVLDFDGLVNMTPNQERYKFHLNVQGADLHKLNFSKEDIRFGLDASADLKGGTMDKLNGTAGIANLILTHDGKKYRLDSVLVASINAPNKSELNVSSALVGLKYNGTISPTLLPDVLMQFIDTYFPFLAVKVPQKKLEPSNFTVEVQLHNHPILSEVFLPQLKEFEPGIITGSFDSQKNELKLSAFMKHILYGSTVINNLALDVHSDSTALNYSLSSSAISNSQINFTNFLFNGKMADNKVLANISSIDNSGSKKLLVQSQITKEKDNFKLVLDPTNFYLMNNRWDIATDNYLEFGKPGFLIHHLFMHNGKSELNIVSVNDRFNDDLNIAIRNFKLEDLSRIVEKDSSLAKGDVDGNILLKRVNNSYGIVADANIANLFVRNVPVGNLMLKANNPTTERFDIDAKLTGTDNNIFASGYFVPNGSVNSLNLKTDIQSLSMKTIQAFSMGQLTEASGSANGNFLLAGSTDAPEITGSLMFNDAFVKPAYLNNFLELKHETIQLKTDGIYFNKFTMLDKDKHVATIDGEVKMKNFSDYNFGLHVNSKDFLLFNTSAADNKEFFGRMVIDSKVDITGPISLPVINARLKMKKGSNFTFAVPDDKLTTDRGEDVIEFNDSTALSSILFRKDKTIVRKTGLSGFDLSSIVEVDKEATLRLLMDPASSDSLVVRGDAALSFTMDRSGKMSLTGAYNLNNGSYLISLEQVIKRKFTIISGSTITWNGDPMDADINLNATYSVRAAPYDLVADQMVGLSDVEKGGYKQLYPFWVQLKLRGAMMKPDISFEIQLPPEEKGILGGAVNQKLLMLNDDPSLLNKQVFALLVLGRFVQENPLQTESGGTSTLVRSTISNLVSAQINQLSSKLVSGMTVNFDIQSYDDYQSGQAKGRTQVEVGLKKELFNRRLTVQVGGTIDVEGEKAKQNSASNVTSDVTVEYKLTDDGRYRLKAFRHDLYDGAIEGQIVETGAGVMYVKDFNSWRKKTKKKTPNP